MAFSDFIILMTRVVSNVELKGDRASLPFKVHVNVQYSGHDTAWLFRTAVTPDTVKFV